VDKLRKIISRRHNKYSLIPPHGSIKTILLKGVRHEKYFRKQ
jgi:hypothetical protein